MPRLVRPMRFDPSDGHPLVGSDRGCLLGVRTTGKYADVDLGPAGEVVLNRKGLSVDADWRRLAGHLIPRELDDGLNGASGKGMKVYVHGQGAFAEGLVAEGLEMRLKPGQSSGGVICPRATVSLDRFQADLQATRASWVEDAS